jgi:hypothetical protein
MRIILIVISLILAPFFGFAQETGINMEGSVTFITASNVYVRFDTTELIEVGDKLKLNGQDCLLVVQKSTSSVVCTLINNCSVTEETKVSITKSKIDTEVEVDPFVDKEEPQTNVDVDPKYKESKSLYSENIRGRVSAGTYNSFSNLRENRNRFQTQFSLNANHIGDSKISVESFLSYRGLSGFPESYSGRTNIFSIYNLNVRFDATESLSVTAGRKINPKASSVGANDGLIVENYFGNFYVGGMGGFRPDFIDYGVNTDLLQYGAYFGIETDDTDFFSQTTFGAMEQTNNGATDRRYVFFQHNSTISSNVNLFGSMEMDIFGGDNGGSRLTNLFVSARFRFSRAVNAMISYDSRKQIIYYETFQTEIERILDDDLSRQGVRLRLNVRPAKILWMGASYSSRFQSDSQNQSDNIYGYATLTKIPSIGGRLNVSYTMNTSRYLTSNILSVRHSRDLVKNKLYADVYFRMADYSYDRFQRDYKQNYYGGGLSYWMSRTWQFNISGELSTFEDEQNGRLYVRLTKRFYSKKKK